MAKGKKKSYEKPRLRDSFLISGLTKFSAWIYTAVLTGLFGLIFTSYNKIAEGFSSSFLLTKLRELIGNMKAPPFKRIKHSIAKMYERSLFLTLFRKCLYKLLTTYVNSLGLLFFSYGFCVSIIYLLKLFTFHIVTENPYKHLIVGFTVMFIGIIMFFSKKSIAKLLYESSIAHFILFDFLGFSIYGVAQAAKTDPKRNFNLSLVFGMLLGAISIFIEPLHIIAFFVFLLVVVLVLDSPESGIILVFLVLPFLTTMQLIFTMCLIYTSYLLKLLCGRRVFRLQLVDFAALAFLAFVFFGGIYTVDSSSFEKMLVFVCFMIAYFVVKNTLRSTALVRRCLYALVSSSVLVSLVGLYQNFFGTLATTWLDTSVFTDIRGRVVSTFQNPNVLGEYIILIFPLILSLMVSAKRKNDKFAFLVAAGINCACLVFTWSRGAWLGFILSLILFFLVSGKNFLTAGILSLPLLGVGLYFAMDTAIMHRFTNLADSSSSYRFNIWRGVLRMLEGIGLHGIGIGEGAFQSVYPAYSLSGIEVAPHSHSLFLQIIVETGIFSLFAFVLLLFFYTQCSLSFCKSANNRANKMICLGIFSGIFAFLVQGLTDYVWYNYRIYLLFWMLLGLGMAHILTASTTEEESENYVSIT